MNGDNISCTCFRKWRTECTSPSTQISFPFFYFAVEILFGWLLGLSPAFYWWQCMLMHEQSNQMSCHTFVPFSGERTQESLVTVTSPAVPIWVTFCECETAKLIYCLANVFVHYKLSHSAIFSVFPVSVWAWWDFFIRTSFEDCVLWFSPFVDSVPQLKLN